MPESVGSVGSSPVGLQTVPVMGEGTAPYSNADIVIPVKNREAHI